MRPDSLAALRLNADQQSGTERGPESEQCVLSNHSSAVSARPAPAVEQAVELFLLGEVKREYRVQAVEHAAQVSNVFQPRPFRRKLSDEASEEPGEAVDLVVGLDERSCRIFFLQHLAKDWVCGLLLLALVG
jgi:hypothetical protein